LWAYWQANDARSTRTVDHSAWDAFLKTHVKPGRDGINRLDYGGVGRSDYAALNDYVSALAAIPVRRLNRAEQRAYWINLYNALTVQTVLQHYPVKSIRDIDISPGLFASGPWGKKLLTVDGEAVSLDDIEHRILRPLWQDPRLHYAVNCASLGCPNLQRDAFTAANSDALLDQGAREYINHPRGVRFNGERLLASSIYDWFKADFGGSDRGVIAHWQKYAAADLQRRLAGQSNIAGHDYDWSLNDAR
ncbi:MAG: DUF547 domain-containing protein, partial [Pseudomonadota bacterium]|nr:DUF547 domain-containing protein [Pseudomonadota bacterium]